MGANFNDFTVALTILAVRSLVLRSTDEAGFQEVLGLCSHRASAPMQLIADFRAAERIAQRCAEILQNQDLVGIMLRCYSNGFARRDDKGETALLLVPSASYFNHSCAPNVCRENCEGLELRFWALDKICKGTPLLLSYVDVPRDEGDPLATTERRRELLQEHYFFHCNCALCSSTKTCCKWAKAWLCPKSAMCRRRGFLIPRGDGRRECSFCHELLRSKT